MISPKTSIKKVMTPVATPTPLDPKRFVKIIVASDAAPILTKLFPIKIVIINLEEFCFILKRAWDPFLSCLSSALTFIRFSDIRAVSIPEKNAEKNSKMTKITICPVGTIFLEKWQNTI